MIQDPVDRLIAVVNMEEAYRRRRVRGKDLNDWHPQLDAWAESGQTVEALRLLGEIMETVENLEQYDPREPQPYWFEVAARIHHRAGRHEEEAAVLRRWLDKWPPSRVGQCPRRAVVEAKLDSALRHYAG